VGRLGIKKSLLVGVGCVSLALMIGGMAAAQSPQNAGASANAGLDGATEVSIPVNKSRIITAKRPFNEVAVGSGAIADVVALSRTQFYILGKTTGSTNVIVTDRDGSVIEVYDVSVGHDIDGLKRRVYEIAPNESVEIRAASDSILLSGTVSDAGKATAIAALAERYAPGKVNNMIGVTGVQQVMLEVRFAEVQRSALKDLSTQVELQDFDPDAGGTFYPTFNLPGEFFGKTLDSFNPLNYFAGAVTFVEAGDFALSLAFDVLEQKGLVRTLAEPNIVALSGDTAKFLAGGEFPIPIAQDGSANSQVAAITVEFKEFGVGLSFTPTVTSKDAINLELAAEVSSIDPSVSTTVGSISVPGLKVRRTNTTVELRDGQSFAIAGLIQDDLTNQVRQIPGLGSIPIIGQLARSEGFERRQTELVVLITARLVKPVSRNQLAAPTDYILAPSEYDFFLFGKTEGVKPSGRTGGIDGTYGYVQP
jgi:pilus assembly protein CpaC